MAKQRKVFDSSKIDDFLIDLVIFDMSFLLISVENILNVLSKDNTNKTNIFYKFFLSQKKHICMYYTFRKTEKRFSHKCGKDVIPNIIKSIKKSSKMLTFVCRFAAHNQYTRCERFTA